MTDPLNSLDLQHYIAQHQIQARLLSNIGHTPTVPAAAAVLGVETDQIIKTLLFLVNRPDAETPAPVVVISNGENRVDKKALAQHFGVTPKKVKLAPAEVVLDLLGYPAGGVPPFGHRTRFPVLVDSEVVALQTRFNNRIFGGGGDDQTMLELSVSELLRVLCPQIAPVSSHSVAS
jgi:prolyl-tRNA editing enzyme YbaK/EbsC (Cys-tRNA(Pro) deacylase)